MKMFIFGLALLVSGSAMASHFMNCSYDAEVVGVKRLARMDGVATFKAGMDDYEQVVSIKLVKRLEADHKGCPPVGTTVDLYVKHEQFGKYNVKDVLRMSHQNVGDSTGSRVSWLVK